MTGREIEIFDPKKLIEGSSGIYYSWERTGKFTEWLLEYGVPFNNIAYRVDSILPLDYDEFDTYRSPDYIKAINRVEELTREKSTTAFCILRPGPEGIGGEEFVVFKNFLYLEIPNQDTVPSPFPRTVI